MANEPRVPRIGLPSDYYSNYGALKIQSGTPNDPGFLDIIPPKTMNPMAPGLRMYPPANLADTGRIRVADSGGMNAFLGGLFNPAARDQNQRMLEASRAAKIYKPYGGAQSSMRAALSGRVPASGPNTDDIINGTFNSLGRDVPFVPATSSVSDMYAGIYSPIPTGDANWMDSLNPVNPRNTYGGAQTSMRDALIARSRLPGEKPQERIRLPTGEWVEVNAANNPNKPAPLEIAIGTRGLPVMLPKSGPIGHGPIGRRRPGGTNFPVANPSSDLVTAYDDMVKGVPGARDRYAQLLADASGTGNIGTSSVPQRRGGLFGMLFGGNANAGGNGRGLFGMVNTPRAQRAPNTYAPATSVSGNTGYRNERTGVLYTSDKGRQYGTSATGQRTDYGASPGQKTAGLKPGDRVYNSDTNSWELK
jgi:hypothetical protein